jgi:hypothetical protein
VLVQQLPLATCKRRDEGFRFRIPSDTDTLRFQHALMLHDLMILRSIGRAVAEHGDQAVASYTTDIRV